MIADQDSITLVLSPPAPCARAVERRHLDDRAGTRLQRTSSHSSPRTQPRRRRPDHRRSSRFHRPAAVPTPRSATTGSPGASTRRRGWWGWGSQHRDGDGWQARNLDDRGADDRQAIGIQRRSRWRRRRWRRNAVTGLDRDDRARHGLPGRRRAHHRTEGSAAVHRVDSLATWKPASRNRCRAVPSLMPDTLGTREPGEPST